MQQNEEAVNRAWGDLESQLQRRADLVPNLVATVKGAANFEKETLQAVISQVLLRRTDKPGRVAALEIMLGVPAVRNLIRESKTFQIPSFLQTSKAQGMQTLDDDIMRLLSQGVISATHAMDKQRFAAFAQRETATQQRPLSLQDDDDY